MPHSKDHLPFHGLGSRIMLIVSLALLSSMLLFSLSIFYYTYRTEGEAWRGRQAEAARNASGVVSNLIQRGLDGLRFVCIIEPDHDVDGPDDLITLLDQNTTLLEVVRINSGGEVLASAHQDAGVLASLITIPQSQWFFVARSGRTYIGNVQISASNEPYIILAVPSDEGGVIAARMEMNVLWEVVQTIHFGANGQAYVVARNGQIIAHTDPQVVLDRTSIRDRFEYAAMMQAVNNEWSGTFINFAGMPVVGNTVAIEGTDWLIVTELPAAEAFQATRSAVLVMGGMTFVLTVVFSLIVSRFLRNAMIEPMEKLRTGAERIGRGDLAHRIGMDRADEIGELSEAFDIMTDQLQERESQLAEQTRATAESEARYRAIVEDQTELICRFLSDGTLSFVNEAYCRYFNCSREELIGSGFMRLIPEGDRSVINKQMELLTPSNPVVSYEHRITLPDGSLRWQAWTDRALFDADGRVVEYASVGRDITERKISQMRLDRQNRILSSLHETTLALMRRLELHDVLQTIVQQAAQLVDTPHAYLYLVTPDGNELKTEIVTGIFEQRHGFQLKKGEGLAGKVWQTGQPMVIADYHAWDQRSLLLDDTEFHAIVGVPLKANSAVMGVLGVTYTEPGRAFTDEDVELMTRFAQLASIALENARLHNLVQQELTARNEAEKNLRRITDNMQDVITQVGPDGTILYASPSHTWIIGVDPGTIIGHSIFERIHPDDIEEAFSILSAAMTQAKRPELFALRYLRSDGAYIWLECSSNLLMDEEGGFVGAVLSSRDITERKKIEKALQESEHLYRLLAENSSDVIWVRDMNLVPVYISPAVYKLRGYTMQEALSMSIEQTLAPDSVTYARRFFAEMLLRADAVSLEKLKDEYRTLELEMFRKDGSTVWTETQVSFLLNEEGKPNGILGVTRDISERKKAADHLQHLNAELEERVRDRTEALLRANENLRTEVNERKLAEEQVRASLREKEVLLKEVHHRVKNSLQIISSLLNLQAHRLTDTQTLQALGDSQARVRSMALIHEKLYQSQSLANIDFGEYVRSLANDLFRSYGSTFRGIQLDVQVDAIALELDQAVSCGLILNELMTNALKYAFPDDRSGTIRVELHSEPEGWFTLRVVDDGVGLPQGFDFKNTRSLGLQLVNSLVRQLDGEIVLEPASGTSIRIVFKI